MEKSQKTFKTLIPSMWVIAVMDNTREFWREKLSKAVSLFHDRGRMPSRRKIVVLQITAQIDPELQKRFDAAEIKQAWEQFHEDGKTDHELLKGVSIVRQIDLADLERIERDGLSDNEFFELLHDTPLWLISEPFQEKIRTWQIIARESHPKDKDSRLRAQERLKWIGETLAFVGQGNTKRDESLHFISSYYRVITALEPIRGQLDSCNGELEAIEAVFRARLPRYQKYAHLAKDHYATNSLAIAILAEAHDCSEETVKNLLKKGKKLLPDFTFERFTDLHASLDCQ